MAHNIKDGSPDQDDRANVLQISLPADLMAFVDRHRHAQKLTPSREETVIAVLRSWAGGKDYWKEIQTPAGGLRPEQLNATNDD